MDDAKLSSLEALPTETLESIFSNFPLTELVALATISRRFYTLVADSVYMRLLHSVALPGYTIILESYPPGQKNMTPYLYCKYMGTNGLDKGRSGAGTPTISTMGDTAKSIPNLLRLYSRFRPTALDDARTQISRGRRRPSVASHIPLVSDKSSQPVQLDGGELFTQLCVETILAKHGDGDGHAVFSNDVKISNEFVRIWRDWMSERCSDGVRRNFKALHLGDDEVECMDDDSAILWVDNKRYIGLRFKVIDTTSHREPVPGLASDDLPVSYRLEYDELLIRSCRLLMSAEKAEVQQRNSSGEEVFVMSSI